MSDLARFGRRLPIGWRLINAIHRAELSETFEIPPLRFRKAAGFGDNVKIGVESNGSGERFWVSIIAADGDDLLGCITNAVHPHMGHGLRFGETIRFRWHHIMDVRTIPPPAIAEGLIQRA